MENLMILIKIAVALSVYYVWIFRYFNVVKEFQLFGLNDVTRNFVGACKISFSALLIAGIWIPEVILISSIGMAFFMVCAQYFHFKVKNPFQKHLPSLVLLILCLFLIFNSTNKLI
jgi:DoxX-like family